jgi:uncharacterized protein YjdB
MKNIFKPFCCLAILLVVCTFSLRAQYGYITNFGTSMVGGIGVTVTSVAPVGVGGPACLLSPLHFWIGATGPGYYTFTFSVPVYSIQVKAEGINGGTFGGGEALQMIINGAPYNLTATDVTSYTGCISGGGPTYLSGGLLYGPVGLTSAYNGGVLTINSCTGITSFSVRDSFAAGGISYDVAIDTVNHPAVVAPITGANIVCTGNIIALSDVSPGGTWSSSSPTIGSITSGGEVTGVSVGTTIITYTVSGVCSTVYALYTVRVGNPIITTFAGGGSSLGDGGAATAALMNYPTSVFVDASDNKLVTEFLGNRVRLINPSGIISTIAGNGVGTSTGDGGLATLSTTNGPAGVCKDLSGNIYIAEQNGCRLRKINSSGIISTIAGTGLCSTTGDGGAAVSATLNVPTGVTTDAAGNIYIAEFSGGRVRKINTSGIISTFAGSGATLGDGGPATAAHLSAPYGVYYDGVGSLFIADQTDYRVRQVNLATNIITTFAGSGVSGFSGDGGPATAAKFAPMGDVYADAINVYVADGNNVRIRLINRGTGIISSIAGNGISGFSGDGGPATAGKLSKVSGVALDAAGNIYIADNINSRIREVSEINPTVAAITGPGIVCQGGTITLADITDGGTWSSSSVAVVTVGTGGVVTGMGGGVADITYTRAFACGFLFVVHPVTVNTLPTPLLPTSATVCVGNSVTFTDAVPGGTWSMTNARATIVGGVVTGVSIGIDTINYAVSGCIASASVTVVAAPAAISPSTATLCVGNSLLMTDATGGGTWSATNSNANVFSGDVTAIAAGLDTIVYSIGACSSQAYLTINAMPAAITPSTPVSICLGGTSTLADVTAGGTWSSGSPTVATVSGSGVVTGISLGTAVIFYSIGICAVTKTVTVVTAPAPISPSSATICSGHGVILTESISGGAWSSNNSNATVVGGAVTGVTAGVSTISYSIGTCVATASITINASPAPISPTSATICVGSTIMLTDATVGGSWSASNANATVAGGLVTGVSAGSDIISYTTGICTSFATITIVSAPAAISPSTASVCIGNTVAFTDATSGGTWSATNANASVSGGVVTGAFAGIDTVVYTIGTCAVSATVTVNSLPAAITPSTAVSLCVGSTTVLADATPGGVWTSSTPSVATVSGGTVTGITVGTTIISYTNGSGCAAIKNVTVIAAPAAISPATTSVCIGSTIVLTDPTPGGTWSAGNGNAVVLGGLVTGISAGTVTISYSIGTCITTAAVTVNTLPAAITPSGAVTMCVGGSATLADASPLGTWSSTAPGTATVTSGGVVTGVSSGSVTILYTNTSGCAASKVVTVSITPSAISPATATLCVGNTITMTNTVAGGIWTSGSPAIATVAGGLVTGMAIGNATITYAIGTCQTTAAVTVNTAPTAGTITGPSSVCVGSSITLADGVPGGIWSSTSPGVASVSGSGVVFGAVAGTATISYTVTNTCGSVGASATVNVLPAGILPIIGASSVCAGTFTTLTDGTVGGSWSASNSHATIVTGTGFITGVSVGTDTITYSVTNVCGTLSTTKIITVGLFLSAGTITGPGNVCAGSSITLTDLAPAGVWGASNAKATVAGGVVTGVTGGVDTITYTVTSSCGSAIATHNVTVNPLPTGGSITGPSSICLGSFVLYTNAVSGGVWSITNSHATISLSGVVTLVSMGTDTIIYTVTNACGTASATKIITIGAFLSAGSITGPTMVCTGATIALTDAVPGGVWSASNSRATISGTGVVTGMTTGIDTIYYTVTGTCGTVSTAQVVTVNLSPAAGSIIGPATLCIGSPASYADVAVGGVWSISNANATISGTGLTTPVTAGLDTISYTVTNVCGSAIATKAVTIGGTVTAGTISGPGIVCTGSTITLTDATPGGVWTSSNTNAAVAGGVVTGVSVGVSTISYTVSASCGSAVATAIVTVSAAPVAGSIIGPATICTGTFVIYTDAAPGGVWSISNALATITPGGLVTALAVGVDTISYTATTGCGSASATKIITISTSTGAGTITGPTNVCVGSSVTLFDATPGGTWSGSNSSAVVSVGGLVTGIAGGVDTIMYSITTGCGTTTATHVVTVSITTPTGSIGGPSGVCLGSSITLVAGIPGGTWSSSNANATVTPSGLVNGVAPGPVSIIYTVTGICGTASISQAMTVDIAPVAGLIAGPTSECAGATMTLTDVAPGGIWTAVNLFATVGSATGVVTGVAEGVDLISYTVANACGIAAATLMITVNPLPDAGTIAGPGNVCVGASISLTDAAVGGTWSAGNANASVSGTGVVTGVTAGTDPITYTVTNSCGIATAVSVISIDLLASAGPISGLSAVCVGTGISLTDPTPGGVWLSSNGNTMVGGPGIIIGVATGVDTILYQVSNSCGTSIAFKILTVNPVPVVAAISGPTSQCTGTTITLTNATAGGIWTSSSPAIAAIGLTSGVASGVSAGIATLTYTVTNSFGCPASVTSLDTVSLMGTMSAILGGAEVCVGSSVTLSDPVTGGVWTSSSPSVATIGATSGIVLGVTAGTVTISYTVSSSCGTSLVTRTETVNALPIVGGIGGTASECVGASTTLTDITPGGVWSSSNMLIATVGSTTGLVTGVAAGINTIYYTVTTTGGCISMVTIVNTVNVTPIVAAITGVASECAGASSTLSDVTAGGVWSSSNPLVATVAGGIVTGVSAGVATITYSVAGSGCTGLALVSNTVNMVPVAGVITGVANVCIGATTALADASVGGVWSTANPLTATISSTGLVTGVSLGTDEIYYSISNACGSVVDSLMITVGAGGSAGTITGATGVCQGASVTLSNVVSGGVWSSSNARATVGSATGIVTGVTTGLDTIKYTVASACGTAVAIRAISINGAANAGIISGFTSVCEGSMITLTESAPGGSWSSSNATRATVSGGNVTGIAAGTVTISYTVSNSCGSRSATHGVSVAPASVCHTMVNNGGAVSSDIFVYPNPATSMLRIEAQVKINVLVLSMDGKVILTQNDATAIDISQLADGMYIVMIYDENGLELKTAKFAKIK